jgi:hypothetical protein
MKPPKPAREPRRIELFTAHTRGGIVRKLKESGSWKGTRKGVRVKLTLSGQPDFDQNRVKWTARFKQEGIEPADYDGRAANGFDALQAIQELLDKRRKEKEPRQ